MDFDWTYFSHKTNSVPKSTVYSLNKLQENNILIFLATGRPIFELKTFNYETNFDAYITKSGQEVYDKSFNLIYSNTISGRQKEIIIQMFNEKKIPMNICCTKDSYMNYYDNDVKKLLDKVDTAMPRISDYDGEEFCVADIFFVRPDIVLPQELLDLSEIAKWHKDAASILPKGASKAKGIKFILDKFNLKQDEIMGIGDGENDIEMLDYCGISVAMGNSMPELKKHADYITSDIDDDGFLNAFKHYNLL